MDRQIFKIMRKICLLLFTGNILVHAIIGASAVNGIMKGSISMIAMLIIIIVLYRAGRDNEIKKNRKKRQKTEQGVSPTF